MELVPTILILSQIRCETTCALVIQSYIFCTAQIPLPIGLRCSMYSVFYKLQYVFSIHEEPRSWQLQYVFSILQT